jgi:hypothetical protein
MLRNAVLKFMVKKKHTRWEICIRSTQISGLSSGLHPVKSFIPVWRIFLYSRVVLLRKQHCVFPERPIHSAVQSRNQGQYGRLSNVHYTFYRLLATNVSIITPGFCTLPIDNASTKYWTFGYLAFLSF